MRVQFISPAKVPILIPLRDVPDPNTSKAIALTVTLAEESVSQNLGDVAVVDIVKVSGNLHAEEYSSVSNQWLGYIELADADTIQQILEMKRNSDR